MNVQETLAETFDHIRGMWRYRWYALGVAWVIAILGWAAVYNMPDIYEASARVSVNSNSLLPKLTRGLTAEENLLNEVSLVYRALLSRPNLAEVIRRTDLRKRTSSQRGLEGQVTRLQNKISIDVGQSGNGKAYTIYYEDEDREIAVNVVAVLLDTFVESSLIAQVDDSDMTENALASEIENHEQRLREAEFTLADFKKRNLGFMPGDGTDYYTHLQSALADVEESEKQIRLLQRRRDEIVRQLKGEFPTLGANSLSPAQAIAGCSQAESILKLQGQLSALQVEFTEKHPRIVMLRDTISAMESVCKNELLAFGGNLPALDSASGSPVANPIYQNLRIQLGNAEVDLASLQEESASNKRLITRLRNDVDKIAEVEVGLKRLNRDYDVIETRHEELIRRWESLQSKKRLDPVTDPVQFQVWEPPYASKTPVAPDRPVMLAGILILAVGAGVALSIGLNLLRPVYFRKYAITKRFGVPVLGSVSMIESPEEVSAGRRGNFVWICANFFLFTLGAIIVVLDDVISPAIVALVGGGGL